MTTLCTMSESPCYHQQGTKKPKSRQCHWWLLRHTKYVFFPSSYNILLINFLATIWLYTMAMRTAGGDGNREMTRRELETTTGGSRRGCVSSPRYVFLSSFFNSTNNNLQVDDVYNDHNTGINTNTTTLSTTTCKWQRAALPVLGSIMPTNNNVMRNNDEEWKPLTGCDELSVLYLLK